MKDNYVDFTAQKKELTRANIRQAHADRYRKQLRREKARRDKIRQQKQSTPPNQKLVPALIVISVTLAVILTALVIAFWQVKTKSEQASITLDGVYNSAYYSMVDNMNNLHVDSAKFANIPTTTSQRQALKNMSKDCNYVVAGLAVLPVNEENVVALTKFFNQVDGLCQSLVNKIDKGEDLTSADINKVTQASIVLGEIKSRLNAHNDLVASPEYNFVDSALYNRDGINEFSSTLGDMSNNEIEYPAMIFDGPYSSALEVKQVKGLSDRVATKDDAMALLTKIFPDAKITYRSKTSGEFDTFDFDVVVNKKTFFAQVTERDCFLLTFSGYASEGLPQIDDDRAVEIARDFADTLDMGDIQPVWVETKDNVSYINLAPVQDDVILYPDLIKVKVDLTASAVIGWEARNYAFNHIDRDISHGILEEEAMSVLGDDYHILSTNTAIIPMDDGTECLTYELVCEKMDGLYYVYVGLSDGQVKDVLKVVETEGVKLLV